MNDQSTEVQLKKLGMGFSQALLVLLCVTAGSQANAQDSSSANENLALEEVTVTARRKEESLQDTPIAIQAFSGDFLDTFRIEDLTGIAARVPGVTLASASTPNPEIFIRGIGNTIQSAGADSAVGIFLNGNYLSRTAGANIDLFDLARVEVLKGPQSLRYGKSVSGGAINYITKRPTEEFESAVEVTVGDYSQLEFGGSARGPISDTVLYSVSAISREHDPYGKNTLGGGGDDLDRVSARGELLFLVNDGLEIKLSGDVTSRSDSGEWLDVYNTGDSEAVTYNRFFAPPIPGLPADFTLPNRNAPFNDGVRSGRRNFNGSNDVDLWGVNLEIDADIGEGLNLVSVTDYRDNEIQTISESCGMFWDFPLIPVRGGLSIPDISSIYSEDVYTYLDRVPDCWFVQDKSEDVQQMSQEFRLSGGEGTGLSWTTGVYYLDEDIKRTENVAFIFPDFSVITEYAFSIAYGGQPTGEDMTQGVSTAITESDSKNYGAFGEVTWDFNERWSLNAGLRYVRDEKNFTVTRFGESFDTPVEGGGFTVTADNDWNDWLPSLAITGLLSDNMTTYFSYARGYKPGGYFGENAGDPQAALLSFDSETSDNFEVGLKTLLAEQRVRLNTAVFYTQYKNLQTEQFIQIDPTRPPDNFISNAKDGTVAYGLELDFEAQLTQSLLAYANYAYTECEFDGSLIIDGEGTDIDGNTCRRTPKHGLNTGLSLAQSISSELMLLADVNFSWKDKYFFDNENTVSDAVPSQYTVDLRAGVGSNDGRWTVTGWVKNATDEDNLTNTFSLFGTLYYTYEPPRTYGVSFRYNF